jgi:uncharacterized protein (TIGR00369 family)
MTETDERLKGFEIWDGADPYEDYCGPLYFGKVDGQTVCRLILEPKHMNAHGSVHGGVLMTFADYSLFILALERLGGINSVTVSMNSEFIGPGVVGDLIEATGEIIHETGKMIFLRGIIRSGDTALLNFSGVLKKIYKKT